MANDVTLIENLDLSLIDPALYEELMERDKKMLGGGIGDNYRISIKGGRFRLIYNGEQQAVSKQSSMNIVIVNSASISRTYYEGTYDPENPTAPTCWSPDTEKPSPDVPADQRQALACRDCPQNIKGSGQGDSRACRFSQRLAVVIEGEWDRVYQLQLPATSIFGKPDGSHMPLQAYVRHLATQKAVTAMILTKMYFDENSETPKLFFKPIRQLEAHELQASIEASKSEAAEQAISFTVAQTDKVQNVDGTKVEKKATPKVEKKAVAEDDEPVEEPKKRETKASDDVSDNNDLADLVSVWDD